MTAADQSTLHVGRSWSGHALEDGCPCPKAACGLVVGATVDATCPQHALAAGKTIRQTHAAEQCPARVTAADQTPATDSERDERLREALDLVQEARVSGFTQIDSDTVFAIDDEVTRLTALPAEQAATIREQVAQAIEAERDAQAALRPISDAMYYGYTKAADAARTAALGSQRTEWQG